MEDYDSFAISDFGEWITYDGDKLGSGKLSYLPYFDYQNDNKAFQVWCPKELDLDEESASNLMPYSGDKCLIAWYANISMDGAQPYNDDYLISPAIKGGTEVSFYLKKVDKNISGETYEIMYSTTTQDPSAFNVLKPTRLQANGSRSRSQCLQMQNTLPSTILEYSKMVLW